MTWKFQLKRVIKAVLTRAGLFALVGDSIHVIKSIQHHRKQLKSKKFISQTSVDNDVALVGVFNGGTDGISNFNHRLFGGPESPFDLYSEVRSAADLNSRIKDIDALKRNANQYKYIVFMIGNSGAHFEVLRNLKSINVGSDTKIMVYMHDVLSWHLLGHYYQNALHLQVEECYPEIAGLDLKDTIVMAERGVLGARVVLPRFQKVDFLVNSTFAQRQLVRDLGKQNETSKIDVIFHPVFSAPRANNERSSQITRIGCFGWVNPLKGHKLLFEALEVLAQTKSFTLVIAGPNLEGLYKQMQPLKKISNITIETVINPTEEELLKVMSTVDLAVQLRPHSFGESSGIVNHLIGLGINTIVSKHGSFKEFGDAVHQVERFLLPRELAAEMGKALETDRSTQMARYRFDHSVEHFKRKFEFSLGLGS